jgi:hypothetical protein
VVTLIETYLAQGLTDVPQREDHHEKEIPVLFIIGHTDL